MRLIVANRDEATCTNFLVIYVRAFLNKPRPLHLSRLGSFSCFRLGVETRNVGIHRSWPVWL